MSERLNPSGFDNQDHGLSWKNKVEMAVGYGKWVGSTAALLYATSAPYDRFALALGLGWTLHNVAWSFTSNMIARINEYDSKNH